ncbi:MAG: hypothetical protein ACRDJF_12600 [Actinomycetota bacterium]
MTRWDVHRTDTDGDEGEEAKEKLPDAARQALDALQCLWGATGQAQEHLMEMSDEHKGQKKDGHQDGSEGCARAVGFGGLDQLSEGEDSTYDREQAMSRMRDAWKTTLKREGKLNEGGGLNLAGEGRDAG